MKSEVVPLADSATQALGPRLITADVVDADNALRHDPRKLAAVLLRLLAQGPQTVRQHTQARAGQQPIHEITAVIDVPGRGERTARRDAAPGGPRRPQHDADPLAVGARAERGARR
jgi:hypothetical protein